MANVTVITVINTLSASGSIMVPSSVFMLYFLAIWPSSFVGVHTQMSATCCHPPVSDTHQICKPCQCKQHQGTIIVLLQNHVSNTRRCCQSSKRQQVGNRVDVFFQFLVVLMVGVCVCVRLPVFHNTSLNDFLSLSSLCGGGGDGVVACWRFELKQRCSGLHVLTLHVQKPVCLMSHYALQMPMFYLTTGFVNVANLIQCVLLGVGLILLDAIMNSVRVC